MAFKTITGVKTISVTQAANLSFTVAALFANSSSHFLVAAASGTDPNGIKRICDCKQPAYAAYVAQVPSVEATNGHVQLFTSGELGVNALAIDESNLLAVGTAYQFDLLTGLTGAYSNIFVTLILFN
jgi:hypothetical protein